MANQNAMGAMLNAYPDSVGGTLGDIVSVLQRPELKNAFTSFYILPSTLRNGRLNNNRNPPSDFEEPVSSTRRSS